MNRLGKDRHRSIRTATPFLLSSVIHLAACNVSTATDTIATGPYYAITADVKDSSSYAAGTSMSVPVRVAYQGRAAGGAATRWAILSGHGFLSDTLTTTDTLGMTHIVWTLGRTPEMNALVVFAGDVADTLYVAAVVGAPSSIGVVGPQSATVSAPSPVILQVVVKDRFGNAVPNAAVMWTSTGGLVSTARAVSDPAGIAATTFTASEPGTYHVTADLPDLATCIFEIVVR